MRYLNARSGSDLRIFLIDVLGDNLILKKTKTKGQIVFDWQVKKPLICQQKYEVNGEIKIGYVQRGTVNALFTCKASKTDRLRNLFFQVNTGKTDFTMTPFGHYVEGRKKIDIISYNAFMLDFDLKLGKEHYQGDTLNFEKQKLYDNIYDELPIKPDYIVESRNGFHVYYLIPSKERKTMSSTDWHWIERGIFDYVKENISDCVDPAVKKSNQIMRVPFSLHKKDDNEDFTVTIKYERNSDLKIEPIEEGNYISAQFAYSIEEIIEAFKIDEKILQEVKNQVGTKGKSKLRTTEKYKIRSDKEKNLAENDVTLLKDKYSVTKAIVEGDFAFFDYLQKILPDKPMSRTKATEYINSIDIRKVLGFENQSLNAAFSSLFYSDDHPSDYFFTNTKTGLASYYCRLENRYYNNIFDIVYHLLNFEEKLSEKEKLLKTFNHVYKIFGLKITANWEDEFSATLSGNIEKFNRIVSHSKKTRYLKCAVKLYNELMNIWEEHVYKNNIDWRTVHRSIGAEWIGKRINLARSTVQKELLLLEYIGLIIRTDKKSDWFICNNEYRFAVINDENITEMVARAKTIRTIMAKPLKEVTRQKLDNLFKKVPHNNHN